MAGLADDRRDHLLGKVREARRLAEAAYTDRLKSLGFWTSCSRPHSHAYECYVVPANGTHLQADELATREAIVAALAREAVGAPPSLSPAELAPYSALSLS